MDYMSLRFNTTVAADKENNVIILEEEDSVMEKSVKRYIFLQDQKVRACLIKMGWTPPEKEVGVDLLDKRRLSACLEFCKDMGTTTLEAAVHAKIFGNFDELRTPQVEGLKDIRDAIFKGMKAKYGSK